jgi:hypothetical protein
MNISKIIIPIILFSQSLYSLVDLHPTGNSSETKYISDLSPQELYSGSSLNFKTEDNTFICSGFPVGNYYFFSERCLGNNFSKAKESLNKIIEAKVHIKPGGVNHSNYGIFPVIGIGVLSHNRAKYGNVAIAKLATPVQAISTDALKIVSSKDLQSAFRYSNIKSSYLNYLNRYAEEMVECSVGEPVNNLHGYYVTGCTKDEIKNSLAVLPVFDGYDLVGLINTYITTSKNHTVRSILPEERELVTGKGLWRYEYVEIEQEENLLQLYVQNFCKSHENVTVSIKIDNLPFPIETTVPKNKSVYLGPVSFEKGFKWKAYNTELVWHNESDADGYYRVTKEDLEIDNNKFLNISCE